MTVFFLSLCLLAQEAKDPPPALTKDEAKAPAPALPDVPAALEEMLAIALRSNPEILQAEAAVRKAQADLNQARLKVTQDVVGAFNERQKERETLETLAAAEDRLRRKMQVGQALQDDADQTVLARVNAKSRLAQKEAQLRYLLGVGGSLTSGGGEGPAGPRREPLMRPEMSADMRQVLAKEVAVNIEGKPLSEVIGSLKDLSDGRLRPVDDLGSLSSPDGTGRMKVYLNLPEAPVRTLLLFLADRHHLCFVFRDYGLLVTTPERAATMYAPTIPEETPLKLE